MYTIIIFDDAVLTVNIIIAGRCSFLLLYRRETGSFFFFLFLNREIVFFVLCVFWLIHCVLTTRECIVYNNIIYIYVLYTAACDKCVYDVIKTRDGCVYTRAGE